MLESSLEGCVRMDVEPGSVLRMVVLMQQASRNRMTAADSCSEARQKRTTSQMIPTDDEGT